jgi:K(+)-stimulated pyrophosphate-energized sodium pump
MVIALPLGLVGLIFCFGALGLLASMAGVLVARVGKNDNISAAINNNTFVTCGIFAVLTFFACWASRFNGFTFGQTMRLWGAGILGLGVGVVIGLVSDYFTGDDKKPVDMVAKACQSGPAFTILSGISYGFLSSCPSLIGIGLAALGSYYLCEPLGPGYGMMGIAISSLGMLSIVGMIVSNDAYGPIVDNARGMAEMGGLGEEVLERCDQLDSAGNTAKAITKGFSIGAAGLTVISMLAAFQTIVQEVTGKPIVFDLMNPTVFFGMLVGVSIPAVFSAMLMMGVDRNAQRMVAEVRRQFRTIPGLKEGTGTPDYNGCIDIAAKGAIRELIPAGLFTILATLVVGFVGGVDAMGGYLTGNITSGLFIALMMSNAGGLWDNAKKYIEAGNYGGKGSPAHKAAVIGDTVGDPFKDTAGPSINTQITVVSLVAQLAAVLFIRYSLF